MFPSVFLASPRDAFRDFETAAQAGYAPAWFKLGRDCFECVVRNRVRSCFYRISMAHFQGRLGVTRPNPQTCLCTDALG